MPKNAEAEIASGPVFSERLGNALNGFGPAGMSVDFHQCPLQFDLLGGHGEFLRLKGQKTPDDRLDLPANHTFVRAGKTGISKKSRAAGKNLLIRRLHVRVGANDGADLSVKHPLEGN